MILPLGVAHLELDSISRTDHYSLVRADRRQESVGSPREGADRSENNLTVFFTASVLGFFFPFQNRF